MFNWFRKKKELFPLEVKDYWYCGIWYLYLSELRERGEWVGPSQDPPFGLLRTPAVDRIAFNPWNTGLSSISRDHGLIEGLVPVTQRQDTIGLYSWDGKKHGGGPYYDGAPWDDGKQVNLIFVRSMPVLEYEKLMIERELR